MWINWERLGFLKTWLEFHSTFSDKFFYKCFLCSFQLWSLSHLWSHSLITPRGASHLKLHPSWILYEMQITPFQICSASRPLDFRLLWCRDECIRLLESTLIYTSSSFQSSKRENPRCPNSQFQGFWIVIFPLAKKHRISLVKWKLMIE